MATTLIIEWQFATYSLFFEPPVSHPTKLQMIMGSLQRCIVSCFYLYNRHTLLY